MLAGVSSVILAGNYTYFGVSTANLSGWPDVLAVLVCGVAGGGMGGLFSQLLVSGDRQYPPTVGRLDLWKIAFSPALADWSSA